MKLILTGGIALCALTLAAADTQQKPTETVLAAPAAVQVQDSPLVRAAKATGRLQKKPTNVITNDTLVKTGGHFTTTKSQSPLPPIPEAPPAVAPPRMSVVERQKQEAAAKAKKEAAAERKAAARRADADFNDDSIEPRYEDPAMQEHMMQQGTQPTTMTSQPPKPPTL